MDKLTKAMVSNWLKHPVTERLIYCLKNEEERYNDTLVDMTKSIMSNMEEYCINMATIRGRLFQLNDLRNFKLFLLTDEEIEAKDEV